MLKLHLVDLLSIRYTTNFAANTVTNRTEGAYTLVYHSYRDDRRKWDKQPSGPSAVLLIPAIAACGGDIFSKYTVAQTKMRHVSKTTPLLGVICLPFDKT